MGAAMRELRTAVMILVEASWQEADGTAFAVPARMEDKSASGACIRMKGNEPQRPLAFRTVLRYLQVLSA